ncbi:MAG TPA: hypothetical protein VE397_02545 [Stellaceae bacterium]|jgi:PBP1b-binding outer membrane lipoprotein LpoB|nr:hypothetical protein [Stellaceae bacterium]
MKTVWAAAGIAALALLLAGCEGPGNGIDAAQDQVEATQQQKNCADPKWKAAHLGIWYSVCRPNAALQ